MTAIFVLIPLIPLLAATVLALGGRQWGEHSHKVGIPAIGLSFGLSVLAFLEVLNRGPISLPLYHLFTSGSLDINLSLYIDQLTVLLLLLVTGVSSVVHVFSSRYMIGDPRYNRFFAVIALFTFSMIMLVMSGNLLMLYVFWEVMGLCSYMLISHWSQRAPAVQAATKAFLVNAIADVGFGFGIILTFWTFGTLDIPTILAQAESLQDKTINMLSWIGLEFHIHPLTIIPFFLFLGAMGKSAQLPFHVWLPFAMEAPTPVSALIHAATMVNAGPFLLVRLSPLIVLSPPAMMFIAVIGGATALFAAMVSMTQSDIKKNLAYSTISQIGFMIMSCGIGAFVAAIFHLLAHGCLKAFLFLSTGNALQSVHANQHSADDHELPSSPHYAIYVGALILACIPPFLIFSGPYEHLWFAHGFVSARIMFWVVGLLTVFFTAVYVFRGMLALFETGPLGGHPHYDRMLDDAPRVFSPSHLVFALIAGGIMIAILVEIWSWMTKFLSPILSSTPVPLEGGSVLTVFPLWLGIPLGVAVGGWAYAVFQQKSGHHRKKREALWKNALYVLLLNKGYFDEIYDYAVVRPTVRFSHWLLRVIDVRWIDSAVNNIAVYSVALAEWLWRVVDVKGIDRVVMGIGEQSLGFGRWLWKVVDIRWLEYNVDQAAKQADSAGQFLADSEPRTLQHQLLVMVFWLVSAIGLLYILV